MARLYIEMAGQLQEQGQRGDAERLSVNGFRPYTPEAVPQYTAWIREDVVLMVALLGFLAEEVRWIRRFLLGLLVIAGVVSFELLRRLH